MAGLNYGNRYTLSTADRPLYHSGQPKKKVYQFNEKQELINEYKSVRECSLATKINRATLIMAIRKSRIQKGYYFSYTNYINPNIEIA